MRVPLIASFVAACLIGCAAAPTAYISNSDREAEPGSLKAGAATVYIARTDAALVWTPTITVDGIEKGVLRQLSYLHFTASPGRHDILMHWAPASLVTDTTFNIELKADKTYYMELGVLRGEYAGTPFLRLVDRSTGEAMIAACKCQDSSASRVN